MASMLMLLLCWLLCASLAFKNMNGEYLTTPTPNAPKGSSFNTKWSEYKNELDGAFEVALPVAGRVDGAHAAPSEQLEHREAIGAFEGPGLPLRHPVPRIASSSVKARGGGGASSAR